MGAVPSRDVHESSLFSCYLGKDNKWQILLLPLTRTFFPSPDCPLFRAFHTARTCDQVYFNFVRPSTSPRPCDQDDVGVSTTHDRVTRGELYRDYVDAIEAHLVQDTSQRLREKLLAGEEILRPLPCAVLEIREVATTKGSSVVSGEEEAKDKVPLLPTSEWVPIALHGRNFEARVLGYYGVRSTQTSTEEDRVLTVGSFVHQSVSEDIFVALTAAAGRMFDEQCRAAGIVRSDATIQQRERSPSSSCDCEQTTAVVQLEGSSPQQVMVSSLVMLPVLFHSSVTRYAVLRSTLECVSLLERRMGRPFVEAAMKVQVTKQGRLEVRVDRKLCDRLLQELLLPMTSWDASSSSATETDHPRPSRTRSDVPPASMPMISFLHELEQTVAQELQVARKAPINHGQWERLGNTGCTWALRPETKSTIRNAIRTFEGLEKNNDGSGRVVDGDDDDDADLGGSADQLSLLPYCMTASAHHNNVPKAWVAEVSAVLRRAVQSTFGEDVALATLEPSSKVPVANVRDFLQRVERELSGSAQVVETILKRIASSNSAQRQTTSTSTTRAIWMVPLTASSNPSLQPPPAAAALPTSGRPGMLQLQIDLPLTHTAESGLLVDSSPQREHHFPGTLRSMFFKP